MAIDARLSIINDPTAPSGDRLRAMEQLESRALGRPKETVEHQALIVATEAGAKTLAIRCARQCTVHRVADGPAVTHAEGHITFVRRR